MTGTKYNRRFCYQCCPGQNYTKSQLKVWTENDVIASINSQAWKNIASQPSKILLHDEIFPSKPVKEK